MSVLAAKSGRTFVVSLLLSFTVLLGCTGMSIAKSGAEFIFDDPVYVEAAKAIERENKLAAKERQAAAGRKKTAAEQAKRAEKLAKREKKDAERAAKNAAKVQKQAERDAKKVAKPEAVPAD